MALNKNQLQTDLYDVFVAMKDAEEATDDDFANGVSEAICNYIKKGTVSTTDGGTVSGGVFEGKGTEKLSGNSTLSPDNCASIIKSACVHMKNMTSGGSNYLAEEIGKGIKKMSTDLKITTSVTGTLTPPSSSPVSPYPPDGGTAEGKVTCSEASLVTALKTLFSDMWNNKDNKDYDGNLEFAKKLASQVHAFWTSGIVSTSGKEDLSGSVGSGAIS